MKSALWFTWLTGLTLLVLSERDKRRATKQVPASLQSDLAILDSRLKVLEQRAKRARARGKR